MVIERIEKQICHELAPLLPATIGLVNLADTRRRNLYLGFERVDQDMAECDKLVQSTAAGCRVAGDEWLLVLGAEASLTLQGLADRYMSKEPIQLRFYSWAQRSGSDPVESVQISSGDIERRMRCLFSPCPAGEPNLLAGLEQLQRHIAYVPVGQVLDLDQLLAGGLPEISSRWRCVDDRGPTPICLLCQSQTFEWTGGAYDCSEGICSACGAIVDFRWGYIEP